uniref:Clade I nitrous oxide reductase n=1 Tax=Mesocestoides corti TaxID=53468 RepID=A0A0R3UNA5_MESCO
LTGTPERSVHIDETRFAEHIIDGVVDGDDPAEDDGGPQRDYRSHDSRVDGVCVHSSGIQQHWFRLFNRLACRSRSDAWQ